MMSAQTLAHPGWRGNGIAPEAWWRHSAFARFSGDSTYPQMTQSLERVVEAGADSIVLPDGLAPVPGSAAVAQTVLPFASRFGTEDDLDALLREASARRMHVLLRANLLRLANSSGELRFWLSRGLAGFDIGDVRLADLDTLQVLRGAMDRFPGRRVVLLHPSQDDVTTRIARDAVAYRTATLPVLSAAELARSGRRDAAVLLDAPGNALPAHTAVVFDSNLLADEERRAAVRVALHAHTASATNADIAARRLHHGRRRRR